MADNNSVTNPLCEARMETIDTKLETIKATTDRTENKLDSLSEICRQIPINTKRLDILEKWKENFSLTKIVLTMSGIAVAITTIYEFIRKLLTHQF